MGNTSGRRRKIARLIEEYDLNGIGVELEHSWTASSDDRMSLRDLAEQFNIRLVESAMADSGMKPLTGEAENVYRLLTKDEVSSGERTRVTRRLERAGIDINQLDRDLVTYQAVRSYLKRDRGAEYASDDRDRTVVETENVQRLRGRMTTVIGGKLEQLQRADNLVLGEGRVIVEFNVLCETCGTRYDIEELLDRGGCDCAGRE
jgi:hypothetical protein